MSDLKIGRAFAVAIAALALLPAAASAADVTITVSADPLEDRVVTFTSAGDPGGSKLFAKYRPAGTAPCARVFDAESGTQIFFQSSLGAQASKVPADPGAYVVCAYLQQGSTDTSAVAASSTPFTVRPNNATLAAQVPPAVNPGARVPVAFVGTTEVGRQIYAKTKAGAAGGCAPSFTAEPSSSSFAIGLSATGAFNVPRLTSAFSTPGQYLVCGWLQESIADPIAEAVTSAIVNVIPPVPQLTGFDIPRSSFRARGSGPSVTTNSPSTLVTYSLTTAATMRFSVRARHAGRRVGSRCLAATPARRKRPLCARFVAVRGSFTQDAGSGYNSFLFSGRIGGRRLKRGSYRLYATPTNTTGRGRALRHVFRIV